MEQRMRVNDEGFVVMDGPVSPVRASGTSTAGYLYSEGGLFGVPGMHPTLVNAMVNPIGIDAWLRWVAASEDKPIYDALTYIGSSGYTQTTACGDCGKPSFKACAQTAPFGRLCQQTQEFQLDKIGRQLRQGVPKMALFGAVTDPSGQTIIPQGGEIRDSFALNVYGVAYNLRQKIGLLHWAGDPSNNSGGYEEYKGFDLLINTGHKDVLTNISCDALDSYIDDYGSNLVGASGSPDIVARISAMVRSINYRVQGMGMSEADLDAALVMSPQHWEVVSQAYACQFGLQCAGWSTANTNVVVNDSREAARMLERLRAEKYVPVDGNRIPVIVDSMQSLTTSAYGTSTKFCGNIYYISRALGGETITYGEYLDMSKTAGAALAQLRQMAGGVPIKVTDGGRFAHAATFSGGFCFDLRTLVVPRLIMRMPQLSGKLQNVCVIPDGRYPSPTGSGLYDEVDGGRTYSNDVYLYD